MNKTVFIIDDDISVSSSLNTFLSTIGFDVVCFEEASEVQELMTDSKKEKSRRNVGEVTTVLLDYSFNGIDINRLISRLKSKHPGTKIILSSGYSIQEVSKHVSLSDVDCFLPKPFSPMKLAKQLGFKVKRTVQ